MPTVAIPARTSWHGLTDDRALSVREAAPRRGERCALCDGCADRVVVAGTGKFVRRTPFCHRCSPRHGTVLGYTQDGCRCAECRAAWAAYRAQLRARDPGRNAEYTRESRRRTNTERNRAFRARRRAEATA